MNAFADTYRSYMAECADAIDEFMGERVVLTPSFSRPNFQPIPEPSKAVEVVAAFTWVSETAFSGSDAKRVSGSRDTELAPLIATRMPRFSFKANCLLFPILRGYRIQRCVDATLWEVTSVKPDGVSRIECAVVQLGRQTQ